MLTSNGKKQEIRYIYLHTLVTRLGYSLERTNIDMDSVDATICARAKVIGSKGIVSSPKIDVQLKATEYECSGDSIAFHISKKNYDDLRQSTMVPKILIVLFLPVERDWFDFDLDKISVYGKGYWMSLKGMSACENRSSVTIYLSQVQRVMDETIQQLMIAAANREELAYVPC
jgi:uncharacterized protein DUF4365